MSSLPLDRLVPGYIRRFEAYVPSRPDRELMRLFGVDHLHRLNNNENVLGPPPNAKRVIEEFDPDLVPIYPSGDCFDLRTCLASKFGKDPNQFLIGNGSCEVIASVIKAFCERGDNIVTADKTFAVYEWVAEFSGFQARLVPLRDQTMDPQAMLDAADGRTKIFFVCNPNNPTGTYWDRDTMDGFLHSVGSDAIVVIDEAYFEYVAEDDYPDGMSLMLDHPNVVVFRTFSKMYGLAALRVGYLCGSMEVVEVIRKTHVVYSVNTLGQKAAAVAVVDDDDFIAATRTMVAEDKAMLQAEFDSLDLAWICGQGNFIMVRVPMSDTLLYRKLAMKGILVRTMTGFRFPGWIRVSLVRRPVMEEFCQALRDVLQGK
ncbi:MAG: aminotransferase class I/II-fold pyridoxal phosphate-dependent enzyme [Deltaproteobacteria bacterium]|nr:aminotransferase class I/II-fold pyridoxal phosphate-dependent enzyme [Deltaproteobacteria bacterium]